jgi:outer membrane lipoprotein-sorting protein
MRKSILLLFCCFLAFNVCAVQNRTPSKADNKPVQTTPASPEDLKNVFAQLDKTAPAFKSAKAKFQWNQYKSAGDVTDVQKGEVVFRRAQAGVEAAIRLTSPDAKPVVLVDSSLKFFRPNPKQLTMDDARSQHAEAESPINVGFGSNGDDMLKSYEIKMESWETVDGVKTARLNLIPKNEKVRASLTNIVLWLDPVRAVALQQKFQEPRGNYLLIHYTDVEMNVQAGSDELKNLFLQSNKAAETFKSAKAKFQWDQYEKVVDETEVQKGEVYFRRTKTGMDAVRVTSPDTKQVVFVDGTLKLFQPKIKQLTIYDATAKRAEVDSLMNIGFGSRSDDILKSYDVKMEGWETVDGVRTARLNLVPKNEKLRASVTSIILWLDPQRDISIQQKFMEPGGNYRLTHYSDIQLNGKVPNDVFELKTPSGTTTVRP